MWRGRTRLVVIASAIVAALLRFPGLFEPLHPDEAGFLMVARSWHPSSTSLYGEYFVDRAPSLIALFKLSDAIGGPYFLRLVGALSCLVLVLLAARIAQEVTGESRAVALAAVATAALVGFARIDPGETKGEILGIPWVLGSCLLALLALRHDRARLAAAAGLCAMVPVGLKQNLVGGLVFGGLLLLGTGVAGRMPWRRVLRLGGAAAAGAAVPVALTVGWTVAAGVPLEKLWFATFGFRVAANGVIANGPLERNASRLSDLGLIALLSGMLAVLVVFLATWVPQWRRDRVLLVATAGMVTMDLVGLVLGGSFWKSYLYNLVPSLVLGLIGVLAVGGVAARIGRITIAWPVLATTAAAVWLGISLALHPAPRIPWNTGLALGAVSQPGDSIVVYGGNAQIAFASGLHDPYYLWTLPTRVLDPHLIRLRELLTGASAPTWVVLEAPLTAWNNTEGSAAEHDLRSAYVSVGRVCGENTWMLRRTPRPHPVFPCNRPVHTW